MVFIKKIFLSLLILSFAFTQEHDFEEKTLELPFSPSKIIYIKNITPKEILDSTLYIGQKIEATYSLLLLSDAKLFDISYEAPIKSDGVELINQDEISWKLQSDGTYQAKYIYKIISKNAKLPQIKATAISKNEKYQDIAISPKVSLEIYNLKSNPKYSGVVGDSLKILRSKTKRYDEANNILVLEIQSDNANLEDFSLPYTDIVKQEFQSIEKDKGIFYCIFPKKYSNFSFDFFSLIKNQFETLSIPIVVSQDSTAGQDDLKPKNIFLLYSTLFLIVAILICIVVYIFFWRKKMVLLMTLCLFVYLLWHIFYRNDIILQKDQIIKILPTHNSTTLFIVSKPMVVEIIGNHQDFYKIITPDGRIGWIERDKKNDKN
ncbi:MULTISPECIES: SH3 domain-containing protein [unclassified Helicobacter]|uniref:SH3 domain-containing protein n=1 Tax=unclassified Helicobacter TaxID=2593540 RepID=UPI000CF18777|nr:MULTISPECIES: SH3 domain-containing protein [unclassified Helicobacter]